MAKASTTAVKNADPRTIRPQEAAHFGALAADWWDPKGSSAMLHKLNPVRLGYIRARIDDHFGVDRRDVRPLAGRRALDVGCGAGLLAEPLARMGADVTAVDAAPENIAAAKNHAAGQGLAIDYRAGELGSMGLTGFDLVTAMEVVEHTADPALFVRQLAACLKPDGLLLMSTPNRTAASRLLLVEAAERLGRIPRGTHDWASFLTPDELTALLADAGLEVTDVTGVSFSPMEGLVLGGSMALNYILAGRFG